MIETEQTVNQMCTIVPKQLTVSKLSRLQKAILREGLNSILELPLQRASSTWRRGQIIMENVLADHFKLSRQDKSPKIPAARVSICRALASLCKRGLVDKIIEPGSMTQYRITAQGELLARSLYPDLVAPTHAQILDECRRVWDNPIRRRDLRSGVTFEQFVRHCETGEPLPELPPKPKPLNVSSTLSFRKTKEHGTRSGCYQCSESRE
jgi:hypothetical protein